MKNITLKIEENLLKQCRHLAVDEDKSLSEWVSDLILKTLKEKERFQKCKSEALKHLKQGFDLGGTPLPRETLYDR